MSDLLNASGAGVRASGRNRSGIGVVRQRSIRLEFERRTPEARLHTAAEAVPAWF